MATKTKSKSKVDEKRKMRKLAPDVLTLEEAAAFLRVTEEQLRSNAQAGGMPARCLGGEWRFARSALLNWLSCPLAQTRLLSGANSETPEEQAAFLELLRVQRDEMDRATKSGRYAEE